MQVLRHFGVLCLMALPNVTPAQNTQEAPLSVIDWLGEKPKVIPKTAVVAKPGEAPVATSALPPVVTVTPLGEGSPRAIGLVPPSVTGLPLDIWQGSETVAIARLLDQLPDLHLPAARSLLYTLLLAEATAPQTAAKQGDLLALARVKALMEAGALDPALSLIEQAGVATSPDHFALWMQISLLLGVEDRDRFLNPDLFEGMPPLPVPRKMDPLTFRMFEAIGEPLPTRTLPPAYAVADLRDIAGWKAQLDAAERLTRIGALPDNTALGTRNVDAISKTLGPAWRAMQEAELEVNFATLYAEPLQQIALEGGSAALRDRIILLSPLYESVGLGDAASPEMTFLVTIARGETPGSVPDMPQAAGIASAFTQPTPRVALITAAQNGQLGASILNSIALLAVTQQRCAMGCPPCAPWGLKISHGAPAFRCSCWTAGDAKRYLSLDFHLSGSASGRTWGGDQYPIGLWPRPKGFRQLSGGPQL